MEMGPTQRMVLTESLLFQDYEPFRIGALDEPQIEKKLPSFKPDSCEINPTLYSDWHLRTERVQYTQLPTYERMDHWVDGVIM